MELGWDMDDYEEVSFEPIKPGWYPARVTAADPNKVKSRKGHRALNLEFTITEGEYEGRKVYTNLWGHTPGARGMTRKFLEALGLDPSEWSREGSPSEDLVNLEAEVKVKQRLETRPEDAGDDWEPRVFHDVDGIRPLK